MAGFIASPVKLHGPHIISFTVRAPALPVALTQSTKGNAPMKYRGKLSKKKSKRIFTKTASRGHKKNSTRAKPMRGGIRL
ncbi:hypothetical protein [Microviridae sp.]|nr:hypothetical protein [Microviridae sp.]